ncbi:outer membrane protein [Luteitalea sp.]
MRAAFRALLLVSVCLLAAPAAVSAQVTAPPGPFVIDLRGAYSSVGRSEELASPRGLALGELPKSVLGLDAGVHVYPVRGKVTLGLGASLLMIGGTQTPGEPEEGAVDAPITPGEFRVRGIVPQLSLNFGSSRGWSYIGGGLGFSQLKAGRAESDLTYSPQLLTINVGGGARWFISEHIAFTLDGRYYRLASKPLEADYVGNPVVTMFVFSAGLGFK